MEPLVIVKRQTRGGDLVAAQWSLPELLEMQKQCRTTMLSALGGDANAKQLVDQIAADATRDGSTTQARSAVCLHLLMDVFTEEQQKRAAQTVVTTAAPTPAPASSTPAPTPAAPSQPAVGATPAASAAGPTCDRSHAPDVHCAICERERFKRVGPTTGARV